LSLSFKKIITSALFLSFLFGAISLAFVNVKTHNKISECTQTDGETKNKLSEEVQDGKVDYLVNNYSTSLYIISTQYALETTNNINFLLSHPPFSPPKS
jgi:hypothetical protein